MKIAIVRGDFSSPWDLQNFKLLARNHQLTLFTGLRPVADLSSLNWLEIISLPSPVDLNFGHISRYTMAVLNRIFTDAHILFGLEEKLKGFDIAHCAETYYAYTLQCLNAKERGYIKKVISTVWETIPHNNEGITGRREFKKRAMKDVDLFLPVTQRARQTLIQEGCDRKKIQVFKPGVDLAAFCPQDITQYKNLHISKNLKILFVGRLVADKGILELLAIFRLLHQQLSNTELVVVGNGPLRNKIDEQGVTLVGSVSYSDMPKVYSLCDIFVHCPIGSATWEEQYGMVLIEAMACGLPIVTVASGGIPENVGDAAIMANPGDFHSLAEGIKRFILSPKLREEYGRRARKRAVEKFDIRKGAEKLEAIYEKVLHDKK